MKVACIQLTSSPDIQGNLDRTASLIREAAGEGAEFIATPENTCRMRSPQNKNIDDAYTQENHPGIPLFSDLAKELGMTLLIGSLTVKASAGKLFNRSFLFAPDGSVNTTYDKIHLFDVKLPNGEDHTESDIVQAGERAVVAKVNDDFSVGLSICYDVRFAYLFRDLAKAGANIIAVPAAFTVPTGKAHWESLLRARAIETGSYVIAPAQVGEHEGGRKTYGHSMIVDPWGKILAQKEEGEGVIIADLKVSKVERARSVIPALEHDRSYKVERV